MRALNRLTISGATTLETVVCLLIGVPIVLALAASFTAALEVYLIARTTAGENAELVALKAIVGGMIEHTGSHRLPLEPRIHPVGAIRFTDGTLHPISHHPRFRPHPESHAISALELDLPASLALKRALPDGSLEICSRWDTAPPPNLQLMLAISPDGMTLCSVALNRIGAQPDCFRTLLHRISSTVVPPADNILPFATVFIPAPREYTVYLSREGGVRYLSHRGDQLVENQPIAGHLKQIEITAQQGGEYLPRTIDAAVTFPSGRKVPFSFSASLASRRWLFTFVGLRTR